MEIVHAESLVPENRLLRKIDAGVDLNWNNVRCFVRELVPEVVALRGKMRRFKSHLQVFRQAEEAVAKGFLLQRPPENLWRAIDYGPYFAFYRRATSLLHACIILRNGGPF